MTRCHTTTLPHRTDASHVSAAWRAVVSYDASQALRCLDGSTPEDREGLSLFIALRWMQRPERVMMWRAENIQACLRIFRRTQHQWLVRDILHSSQGSLFGFCLAPSIRKLISTDERVPFFPSVEVKEKGYKL